MSAALTRVATGKKEHASLGIIRLDYNYPPAPGDIDHPGSFAYDVYYRVVPGLTFGLVQEFRGIDKKTNIPYSFRYEKDGKGKITKEFPNEKIPMDETVRVAVLDKVQELINKGCEGITGDCGFMMWLQPMIRATKRTTVPVFMSSLVQLPAVTCGFGKHDMIMVLTANGESLKPMRQLIRDECGMEEGIDGKRYVIAGTEMVPIFGEAVAKGTKVPWEKVQPDMVKRVKEVLDQHKDENGKWKIRAIFSECTELPPYSDILRKETGLPVWDAITCCDMFITGYVDNPRFGAKDIHEAWDGEQEEYTHGECLSEEEKAQLKFKPSVAVDKADNSSKSCTPKKPHGAAKTRAKQSHASMGIIRLEYDYEAAPGDIDHPGSFNYDVFYDIVPGLTFELVQSFRGVDEKTGIPYSLSEDGSTKVPMPDKVRDRIFEAVAAFEKKKVSGITGDCGFMMWMQKMLRLKTHLPVFMSSLAQLPAITCGFGKNEKILVLTANGQSLTPMRDLMRDECGIDDNKKCPDGNKRFIIAGTEMVPIFGEAVAKGWKVDWEAVQPLMVKRVMEEIEKETDGNGNCKIRAILSECTELPPYSDILRQATGLPVYDAITCCDMFITSRIDNPRFGAEWQSPWDGKQEA